MMNNGSQKGIVRELGRPGTRVLGISEYGDPQGLPVLAFHGIPGTRLMFRSFDAPARDAGLRIIAPDRPGFGRSSPQPGRNLRDWLLEVEAILGACTVDRFSLIGISGGGPFAAATAAHFGDRVAALALVGPMGPVAEMGGHPDLSRLERSFFLRAPHIPGVLRGLLAPANAMFRTAPGFHYDLFVKTLPPADRNIMRRPHLRALVVEDVLESLKQDGEGMRSDLKIFGRPWAVEYKAITAPSVLWQGMDDTIVPIAAAQHLAHVIPGCELHRIPHAGHFWVYDNVEAIIQAIREMSFAA